MEEIKMWIIECSSGYRDDRCQWINGVFNNEKLANEICGRLNDDMDKILEKGEPINSEDELTDEQLEIKGGLWQDYYDAQDWNQAHVIEFVLNKQGGQVYGR